MSKDPYIQNKWQAIDDAFEGASSITGAKEKEETTSTSTSVASASY